MLRKTQRKTVILHKIQYKMRHSIIHRPLFFLLLTIVTFASASAAETPAPFRRKALIKEVKAYNKAGSFAKSDEALRAAFARYPQALADAELLNYEVNAQNELVKLENRKIFLQSKPDTVSYLSHVLQTYQYALRCDSADRQPDAKGRVRPRFSANLSDKLTSLRNNLRSGGKFYYKKRNYKEAYTFLDLYLRTIHHPLLQRTAARNEAALSSDSTEMAQLAVISAYAEQQYADVLTYIDCAQGDTANLALMLEIEAKSHAALEHDREYVNTLKRGFQLYPQREYFYASRIQYYNTQESHHQALDVITRALAANAPTDTLTTTKLLYLQGKQWQFLHQPDSAAQSFHHLLDIDPENAEAYACLGDIQIFLAHQFYDNANLRIGSREYAENRRRLNTFYRQAQTAYEYARRLAPQRPELWQTGLREAYYKLGEGKKLQDLE